MARFRVSRALGRRRRRPRPYRWASFCLLLVAAVWLSRADIQDWLHLQALGVEHMLGLALAALLMIVVAGLLTGVARRSWHEFANDHAEKRQIQLLAPWVIDGDTIEDHASGVRYRLANIDAPETGESAKCYNERTRGAEAKTAAIRLIRSARTVSIRRTFRTDRFGRRVAFVLVDDQDLGEALMRKGLACPWQGRRLRWCGARGQFAKIASSGARPFACETCKDWR